MQHLTAKKIGSTLGLMALLAAGNANALGTLAINIEPNNTAGARVIVIGPAGPNTATRSTAVDQRLSLPPGRYQVFTPGVRRAAPIVDSVFGVVNKPVVNIVNGQVVPLLANFDQLRPGTGRLWLPVRLDGQVQSFARVQLASGSDAPGVTITGAGNQPINAIFDTRGNMWVASFGDNTVLRYSPPKLAAPGGSRVPDVILRTNATGSLNGPLGLAFDRLGNLWVGNYGPQTGVGGAGDNTIVKFTRGQIAASGAPTPTVILRGFDNPYGHTFDAQGNLWVGNSRANNVLRFAPARQINGGTPDVTIRETSIGTLSGPRGPVFDRDGNLWVASATDERVAGYSISGTTVTPLSTITLQDEQGRPVPSPDGLAFDNQGFLWVTGTGGFLYRYSKTSLTPPGGIKQPVTTISGFGSTRGVLISFNPKPKPLPATP